MSITCVGCPAEGLVCEDAATINVAPGFYRPDDWWVPSRCAKMHSCLGGVSSGNASCAEGTQGPLCGQCMPQWHMGIRGCEECTAKGIIGVGVILLVLVLTLGSWGLCAYLRAHLPPPGEHTTSLDAVADSREVSRKPSDKSIPSDSSTAQEKREGACTHRTPCSGGEWLRRWRSLPPSMWRQTMTICKIFIAYLQILDVFPYFQTVAWPSVFLSFLKALDLSKLLGVKIWVADLLLPVQCAISVPIGFYPRLIVTLLLPIGLWSIVYSFATVVVKWNGRDAATRAALFASPAVANVNIWILLFLYPSLCRTTLSVFQCTPLFVGPTDNLPLPSKPDTQFPHGQHPAVKHLLFSDPVIECYTPEWTVCALLAVVGIVVYCIGAPLLFLLLTAKYRADPKVRPRISLLLVSYGHSDGSVWFYESVDMLRKLLLTSVVLIVEPDTRVQLWFGLIVSMSFASMTIALKPYRDQIPGMIQVAAQLQVAFTYAAAMLFSHSEAAEAGSSTHQHSLSFGVLLVCMNMVAFVLLVCFLVAAMLHQRRTLSEFKLVGPDGLAVLPERPSAGSGGYHLFLSHVWRWGQDQAGTLKSVLQALMPTLRCFLDVDSLKDIGQLEAYVQDSDVVLIMLTKDYIASRNCRRELIAAWRAKKPLIVLRETDAQHGAVTLPALREEVSILPMQEEREAGGEIVRMVEAGEALEWHREGHLKRATLSAIAQVIIDVQQGRRSQGARRSVRVLPALQGDSSARGSTNGVPAVPDRSVCVHLLSEYEALAPELHAQLTQCLQHAGITVQSTHESEVPTLVLLCPEMLGDDEGGNLTARLRDREGLRARLKEVLEPLEDGQPRPMVLLYSTVVPFDHYIQHCPPDLKACGLLNQMFEKWPESPDLQAAAAAHLRQGLLGTAAVPHTAQTSLTSCLRGWTNLASRRGVIKQGTTRRWRWWPWTIGAKTSPLLVKDEDTKVNVTEATDAGDRSRARSRSALSLRLRAESDKAAGLNGMVSSKL
jgi:hypothetical protein